MNNSEAAKKRIGKTPEERSAYMARIARIRWDKMSEEKRKELINKMIIKRNEYRRHNK